MRISVSRLPRVPHNLPGAGRAEVVRSDSGGSDEMQTTLRTRSIGGGNFCYRGRRIIGDNCWLAWGGDDSGIVRAVTTDAGDQQRSGNNNSKQVLELHLIIQWATTENG